MSLLIDLQNFIILSCVFLLIVAFINHSVCKRNQHNRYLAIRGDIRKIEPNLVDYPGDFTIVDTILGSDSIDDIWIMRDDGLVWAPGDEVKQMISRFKAAINQSASYLKIAIAIFSACLGHYLIFWLIYLMMTQ